MPAAVPVGMVCLYYIDATGREAELGRMVLGDARHAGRGPATEACRLLVGLAREFGIERLHLQVLEGNVRVLALDERVGFAPDAAHDALAARADGTSVRVLGMSLALPP